jgi:hypothetical protein
MVKNKSLSYWDMNFSHRPFIGTENGTQTQVQKYLLL